MSGTVRMHTNSSVAARCLRHSALLLLGVFGLITAHAQDTVIYRCTDANGAVTLQNNKPCPAGSRQDVRRYSPVPTAAKPPVSATSAKSTPTVVEPESRASTQTSSTSTPAATASRTPPPPLYQCRTWDEREYLGDVAEPPAQCVPMETVGIDGSLARAAGSACEMRRDDCTPVPQERLCAEWQRRINEAEFRWKFGGSRNDDRKREYERLLAIHDGSVCVK